ncbi:MAG: UDP-N-acetylmuramate--L-alanine ligase [Bacteroidia bacterium]|nr:UDP-N-acetylmuramate--L-alanine ligase [Bacteroidia bacterium]NNM16730.1 UDP-N-acetylmuramate--L-alanine ligase [Bacteroidia bacterium]
MDLRDIKYVYLIGIGGIGMSALAKYFKALGCEVSGYDLRKTIITDQLEKETIPVLFEDEIENIPYYVKEENLGKLLIIYTPAIPKDHKQFNHIKERDFPVFKRSQVLGIITKSHFTVAVAGTHGKTTTSSIIAHIFNEGRINTTAFLGGIANNFESNFLLGSFKDSDHTIVVEADEFDRSFLTLYPNLAVITSIDADHMDIYDSKDDMVESFQKFVEQINKKGLLITKKELVHHFNHKNMSTYGIDDGSDYCAKNVRVENHKYIFDIDTPKENYKNVELGLPGRHNIENAIASVAISQNMGMEQEKIQEALKTYKGVKRRFDVRFDTDKVTYIDDYAHHPTELDAIIQSVKELYPAYELMGIFQPHLFSRTQDFADDFAQSLSQLDELVLLDIYPAREEPIPGVDSQMLLDKISLKNKDLVPKDEVLEKIRESKPRVLLTLGAGDIDQLVMPIEDLLISLN